MTGINDRRRIRADCHESAQTCTHFNGAARLTIDAFSVFAEGRRRPGSTGLPLLPTNPID
jgi:hypothetical protein